MSQDYVFPKRFITRMFKKLKRKAFTVTAHLMRGCDKVETRPSVQNHAHKHARAR